MSFICQKTWAEKYVTHERTVSIKTLRHRCELPDGHDSDDAKKKRPCQCFCCTPRVEFRHRKEDVA